VLITATRVVRAPKPPPDDPELRDFFEKFMQNRSPAPGNPPARSIGSGVIISADGYLLTAEHIVDAADEISARLADGRTLAATLVGKDRRVGIALLKLPGSGLPVAAPGDPRKLRLGERVFALGGVPGGRTPAVTDGIVSALGVEEGATAGYLQSTAPLYPAMGGGPLFSLDGQLIGINSMLYSRATNNGISFAVPIDDAMWSVNELRAHGRVRRGTMGVTLQEVTALTAATYGLDAPAGVMVVTMEAGGPSAQAGIQAGDLLMRINGEPLRSVSHAVRVVGRTKPGDQALVRVRRMKDVREEDIRVTLGEAAEK
jgi:serine protease Do